MLPDIFKGPQRVFFEKSEWRRYLSQLGGYAEKFDREFLRQVPYDHFDTFNEWFPWFDVDQAETGRLVLTAAEVRDLVRYFDNEPMNWWHKQFDSFWETNYPYEVFQEMIKLRTWPFVPILLANPDGDLGSPVRGRGGCPFHLIEGTHRVSYLTRMLELGLVQEDSAHEVVVVCVSQPAALPLA